MNIKMQKKEQYILLFLFFILILAPNAQSYSIEPGKKNVYFFWGIGCPHCENVINSGILEKAAKIENVTIYQLEVYNSQENREKYIEFADKLNIDQYQRGIPLIVIECEERYSYLIGDTPIINNLINIVTNCTIKKEIKTEGISSHNPHAQKLTLWSVVIAAIIDSINPCAFGVLIFLLATMISMASSKRALKYGLIYTLIIFLVYFSVGLGIIKIINLLSDIIKPIILATGFLVFIGGIIEIKDFFFYGKGFSLSIPVSIKPFLEKITKKGTLPAIILLGIIVSLIELPCTGGIYLAILSLMHINKTFGISYLLLYNLIFVLPLIIIVFTTYYGTKTEKVSSWIECNKHYMRLAAGLIMIILAIYLLNLVYNWI